MSASIFISVLYCLREICFRLTDYIHTKATAQLSRTTHNTSAHEEHNHEFPCWGEKNEWLVSGCYCTIKYVIWLKCRTVSQAFCDANITPHACFNFTERQMYGQLEPPVCHQTASAGSPVGGYSSPHGVFIEAWASLRAFLIGNWNETAHLTHDPMPAAGSWFMPEGSNLNQAGMSSRRTCFTSSVPTDQEYSVATAATCQQDPLPIRKPNGGVSAALLEIPG